MRNATKHLSCLLLFVLSTTVLAQSSYTARIPAAIAVGEFAEAEMLITEGIKIGVISALAAESYRADIRRAQEDAVASQQGKRQSTVDADPEVRVGPRQSPGNEPELRRPPIPPIPLEPGNGRKEKQGRIYVTYTKFNKKTKLYYSGRTSMVIDLNKSLDGQAQKAVDQRDRNHHIEDENTEPMGSTFTPARADKYDWGVAVDYKLRYGDIAYWRIRGREQMLIDYFGGAWSDTGTPHKTENEKRGVDKNHEKGLLFYNAAKDYWGNKFGEKEIGYTGY
jgi:hypothetical protein